jgi:phospholipid/cholesterol/gamma-HCH transport system ATP-binding protein
VIELADVHAWLGGRPVLCGVDLAIPDALLCAIVGPSGAGKSVLLRHVVGLLCAGRGRVLVDGEDMGRLGGRSLRRAREKFGVLFQGGALFDSLTIFDNVAFPLREKTALDEPAVARVVAARLDEVGLADAAGKLPAELSGGMRKRAALARAIVLDPEIALFDEPTTGLDPIRRRSIHRLIRAAWERRRFTGVIVSHDLPDVFDVVDHVVVLDEGRVLESGPPAAVRASCDARVRRFINGGDEEEEARR